MKLVLKLPLCLLGGNNRLNVCGDEVMSRNSVLLYEALFCFLPMGKYVQLNFLTLAKMTAKYHMCKRNRSYLMCPTEAE